MKGNPDAFRPLQIVHDFRFTPIGMKEPNGWPEGADEAAKRACVAARLARLKALGFGGVVINVDFDRYLEDEAAWERFLFAFDEAVALGLRVWIYDEQYYPSGLAGGLVLRDHPEWEAQALCCVARDAAGAGAPVRVQSPYGHGSLRFAFAVPRDADGALRFDRTADVSRFRSAGGGLAWRPPEAGAWRVYAFFMRTHYEGSYVCQGLRTASRPPCAMNPDATERFLRLTLDEYARRLGPARLAKAEAFFSDEPGLAVHEPWPEGRTPGRTPFPSQAILEPADLAIPILPFLPWSAAVERGMEGRLSALPEIFEGAGERADRLRERFWELLPDAVEAGWFEPYRRRAEALGVRSAGHLRNAWRIEDHVVVCGDLLRALGRMHVPGTDRLDSLPETRAPGDDSRLAASAARHYGRKDVLCEISHMYNGTDPLTLPMMRCTAAQQFARGTTVFASYYDERLLPDADYRAYTDFVARLGARLAAGEPRAEALVYLPYGQFRRLLPGLAAGGAAPTAALREEIWRIVRELAARQVDFDFVNEEILAASRVEGGRLVTPRGDRYARLVFPPAGFLPERIGRLAAEAARAGIPVHMTGAPRRVDGLPGGAELRFGESFAEKSRTGLRLLGDAPSVLHLHKENGAEDLELLVQQRREPIRFAAELPGPSAALTAWFAETDREVPLEGRPAGGATRFELEMPPYGAAIVARTRA